MFSLKYCSLLQFDTEMRADAGNARYNLSTLFGVTQAPCDSQINVLKKFTWDDDKNGKQTIFAWVTNLQNKGYNLEHPYAHGKQFLCSSLGGLMLLGFLIDEIQELACRLFQAARGAYRTPSKQPSSPYDQFRQFSGRNLRARRILSVTSMRFKTLAGNCWQVITRRRQNHATWQIAAPVPQGRGRGSTLR